MRIADSDALLSALKAFFAARDRANVDPENESNWRAYYAALGELRDVYERVANAQ